MKKLYLVKMFRDFPKRQGKDRLLGEFLNLKQAQEYSIALNSQYEKRYYVEEIDLYPNESATS